MSAWCLQGWWRLFSNWNVYLDFETYLVYYFFVGFIICLYFAKAFFLLISSKIYFACVVCVIVSLYVIAVFDDFSRGGIAILEFLPEGAPMGVSVTVCFLELTSYFIRPFVLLLRPCVNFGIGELGGLCLASYYFVIWPVGVLCFFWSIYESFVFFVQWSVVLCLVDVTRGG